MKSGLKKSGRYNFFATRDLIGELQTINILQVTCRRMLTQKLSGEKISKHEQRVTETLIHNLFGKERVFLSFQRTIFVK